MYVYAPVKVSKAAVTGTLVGGMRRMGLVRALVVAEGRSIPGYGQICQEARSPFGERASGVEGVSGIV